MPHGCQKEKASFCQMEFVFKETSVQEAGGLTEKKGLFFPGQSVDMEALGVGALTFFPKGPMDSVVFASSGWIHIAMCDVAFLNKRLFIEQFLIHSQMKQKVQRFPLCPLPPHM